MGPHSSAVPFLVGTASQTAIARSNTCLPPALQAPWVTAYSFREAPKHRILQTLQWVLYVLILLSHQCKKHRLRQNGPRAVWSSVPKFTTLEPSVGFGQWSQDGPHSSSQLLPWIRGSHLLQPTQPASLILRCDNSSFAVKACPPFSLFCPSFLSLSTFFKVRTSWVLCFPIWRFFLSLQTAEFQIPGQIYPLKLWLSGRAQNNSLFSLLCSILQQYGQEQWKCQGYFQAATGSTTTFSDAAISWK